MSQPYPGNMTFTHANDQITAVLPEPVGPRQIGSVEVQFWGKPSSGRVCSDTGST